MNGIKDPKHKKLFTEGGFKPHKGARYHSLVKRFNVFIDFYNLMNGDFKDDTGGRMTRMMRVSEIIFEELQKERYSQISREDIRYEKNNPKSNPQIRVLKDVKECEKTLLSCCQGMFPKSIGVSKDSKSC